MPDYLLIMYCVICVCKSDLTLSRQDVSQTYTVCEGGVTVFSHVDAAFTLLLYPLNILSQIIDYL